MKPADSKALVNTSHGIYVPLRITMGLQPNALPVNTRRMQETAKALRVKMPREAFSGYGVAAYDEIDCGDVHVFDQKGMGFPSTHRTAQWSSA